MRDTLKRLIKLSAGYSLVTLIGPLFTVFLTPLYTRVLEPADYGVVDVALTFGSAIYILILLSLDQSFSTYYFDVNETERRSLFSTALTITLAVGIIILGGTTLFSEKLAVFLFNDPARNKTVFFSAINALALAILSLVNMGLRLRMDMKRVNILGLTSLLLLVSSNIFFVLFLGLKATGIVAANAIANSIAAAISLVFAQPLFGKPNKLLGLPLLRTGIGLVPGVFGFLAFSSADRILLTQTVSQNDLGLYSLANKLASMVYVAINPIWSAWWPMALEMSKQANAPKQYARIFEYFAAGSMLISLVLGLFAPEVLAVFTRSQYIPASPFALILMIHVGPLAIATMFFNIGLYIGKRTYLTSIILIVTAIINILLNLWLNPLWGVWGAVWATIIASACQVLLTFWVSRQIFFVDYRWVRLFTLFATYFVLALLGLFIPVSLSFVSRWMLLCGFISVLFFVGVISLRHVKLVKSAAYTYITKRRPI